MEQESAHLIKAIILLIRTSQACARYALWVHALLTVITPVARMSGQLHRIRDWVPKAVESGLIKVILVHDNWDEETGNELNEFVQKLNHPNLELVEGTFRSPGLTRNAALNLVETPFMAFWDSDDLPIISAVLELAQNSNLNANTIYVCHFLVKNNHGEITKIEGKWSRYQTVNFIKLALNPGLWRIVFPTSPVKGLLFTPYSMGEDQLFVLSALEACTDIKFINSNIYEYTKGRSGQLTSSKSKRKYIPVMNDFPVTHSNKFSIILVEIIILTRLLISGLKYDATSRRQLAKTYLTKFIMIFFEPYQKKSS